MIIDKNYIFETSISVDNYHSKKQASVAISGNRNDLKDAGLKFKMGFKRQTVTIDKMFNYCINGYTFCNCFSNFPDNGNGKTFVRKSDNAFTMSAKADAYFQKAYTICFDVEDTKYRTAEEYIDTLCCKPSFYYSSFSNQQTREDGTNKGARFRMVYVFDSPITNKGWFSWAWNIMNSIVETCTGEEMHDKCARKVSQYFNGCDANNKALIVETGVTDLVYSLEEFGISEEYYNTYIEEQQATQQASSIYSDREFSCQTQNSTCSEDLISKLNYMDFDEFLKQERRNYRIFWRVEKEDWIGGLYQFVDNDYFSLYYNANIVKDGNSRRKKLFERMCLRRIMFPGVDADTLLVNAWFDLNKFFEIDSDTSIDCLVRNVENSFKYSIQELEEMYSENLAYLRSRKPKCGIILKPGITFETTERNQLLKSIRKSLILNLYDANLTVKENAVVISDNLFKIGVSTLYKYISELEDNNIYNIKSSKQITKHHHSIVTEKLVAKLSENLTTREIAKELGVTHQYISNLICKMKKDGKIENIGTNRKPNWVIKEEMNNASTETKIIIPNDAIGAKLQGLIDKKVISINWNEWIGEEIGFYFAQAFRQPLKEDRDCIAEWYEKKIVPQFAA